VNFIAWMIIVCEIGFWIFVILGLITRYIFKFNKLGFTFLALTPVIDLVLLVVTSIDLYQGATATVAHAVAAIYIGVSIVFGKSMIQWADVRFQYYVMKQGLKPSKKHGKEFAKQDLKGFGKHLLAYLIGTGFLLVNVFFINDFSRTFILVVVAIGWTVTLIIDLLITISYFIWPKKPKA